MSAGFHRLGANAGKVVGWSNKRSPMWEPVTLPQLEAAEKFMAENVAPAPVKPEIVFSSDPFSPGPAAALTQTEARQQGYTGDQCSKCNSMRMQMAGHCMVCADCGETTGCS